jgi:hypothetical protein
VSVIGILAVDVAHKNKEVNRIEKNYSQAELTPISVP